MGELSRKSSHTFNEFINMLKLFCYSYNVPILHLSILIVTYESMRQNVTTKHLKPFLQKWPGLNKIQFHMYDHYLKNETELHENVSTGTESFVYTI